MRDIRSPSKLGECMEVESSFHRSWEIVLRALLCVLRKTTKWLEFIWALGKLHLPH